MREIEKTALQHFEESLHVLVHKHKELKEENKQLAALIEEKECALKDLQQRLTSIENNYNNLKQAKVISLSDNEVSATRDRITLLVREIDQCIESLKKQQ